VVLRAHFDPQDRAHDPFPLLPFDVPAGVGCLHVSYTFSHPLSADRVGWEEGNIVDVGIFDPRGASFPNGRGFRGTSGSFRQEFTVCGAEATPGYLPGPIQPGTWHVLLGLYQVMAAGCDVEVMIHMERGAEGGELGVPCPLDPAPRATGPRWFRGDLHAHSHHSDGGAPLDALLAAARAQGLDYLAVTEHNTVSHLPRLGQLDSARPLLIPGVEITTYRGHANVWPVTDWLDFRCWSDDRMRVVREIARERGALFSINHPKDGGPPWEFGEFFEPDCVEVWGAPWFISNYQSLALWDAMLRQGRRVTAVGGSDKHQGPFTGELGWYELGTPTTWVWAEELSIPALVAGLRQGRVFVSEGPAGPRIELVAEANGRRAAMGDALPAPAGSLLRLICRVWGWAGSVLRLVSAQRVLQAEVADEEFVQRWEVEVGDDLYFRPEVIEPPEAPLDEEPAALMARAVGNPIYCR
jgi:hypothetical protein